MSRKNGFKWYARFCDGRESTKDDPRLGLPLTIRNEDNVRKVVEILRNDRYASISLIEELTGMPKATIHQILMDLNGQNGLKDNFQEDIPLDLTPVKTCHDNKPKSTVNAGELIGKSKEELTKGDEESRMPVKVDVKTANQKSDASYQDIYKVQRPFCWSPEPYGLPEEKMILDEITDPALLALQIVTCEISPGEWSTVDPGYQPIQSIAKSGTSQSFKTSVSNHLSSGTTKYGKCVRRSEDELKKAADCVGQGMTFQRVSRIFGIPVSTIHFYMARRGILPPRGRRRVQSFPVDMSPPSVPNGSAENPYDSAH